MAEQKNKYDAIREKVRTRNEEKRKAREMASVPLNQIFGKSENQQKASDAFSQMFGRTKEKRNENR